MIYVPAVKEIARQLETLELEPQLEFKAGNKNRTWTLWSNNKGTQVTATSEREEAKKTIIIVPEQSYRVREDAYALENNARKIEEILERKRSVKTQLVTLLVPTAIGGLVAGSKGAAAGALVGGLLNIADSHYFLEYQKSKEIENLVARNLKGFTGERGLDYLFTPQS